MLVNTTVAFLIRPENLSLAAVLGVIYFLLPWAINYVQLRRLKTPSVDVPVINLRGEDFDGAAEYYLYHFKEILEQGYGRFKGLYNKGAFQVWGIDGYIVIVSPEYLEELNALGTDTLDFHSASQKRIIGDYEWLRIADELEAHTILTDLTRNIGNLLPNIHKEIEHAISTEWPSCPEWTPVKVWPSMFRTMALVISLMIVGPELSRDEYWLNTMISFVEDVFVGGWQLKKHSLFMRPIMARGLVPGIRRVWQHQENARRLIVPMISRRRAEKARAEAAGEKYVKPQDMVYWLSEGAAKTVPPRSDANVAELCLMMNFAALHAATVTLTNIVFDLAARPEYIAPLRDEYSTAKARYGGFTEKQAILVNSLSRLDSFMKESQRMNPGTLTTFSRLVRRDVQLSSGLVLPAGTHILAPAAMISLDGNVYKDPLQFQGFRFHDQRIADEDSMYAKQFTTTSPQQMHFGYGRQACPGRFFASAVIKCITMHILETFDLKLVDQAAGRPKNALKGAMNMPSETAEIMMVQRGSGK
ncbi:cytochrome P450 [Chaetomium tenue]|uniref:Cytochrome P450 n=1 Tax=Chaetomium tenue TaxID=1854479 RepID=A0ACB7NWI8_9PEZI|nr:cytochrome P450 [Chaetomium globosum]